jgi:hypothetical protein
MEPLRGGFQKGHLLISTICNDFGTCAKVATQLRTHQLIFMLKAMDVNGRFGQSNVHIFKIMLQGQIIFSQSRRKPEWKVSVC